MATVALPRSSTTTMKGDLTVVDLRNEPEIFPCDRELPQIMDRGNYVENIHIAVGFAARCWPGFQAAVSSV